LSRDEIFATGSWLFLIEIHIQHCCFYFPVCYLVFIQEKPGWKSEP